MKPIIQNIEFSNHIGHCKYWRGRGTCKDGTPYSAIKITENQILLQTAEIQIDKSKAHETRLFPS